MYTPQERGGPPLLPCHPGPGGLGMASYSLLSNVDEAFVSGLQKMSELATCLVHYTAE